MPSALDKDRYEELAEKVKALKGMQTKVLTLMFQEMPGMSGDYVKRDDVLHLLEEQEGKTKSSTVNLEVMPGNRVDVHMKQPLFDLVRYEGKPRQFVEFEGRAIYKLGGESLGFSEFQAETVKFLSQ